MIGFWDHHCNTEQFTGAYNFTTQKIKNLYESTIRITCEVHEYCGIYPLLDNDQETNN
jgi:hypothetical protein